MSKEKYDKRLAELLRENPSFKKIITEAESENDRGYAIAEFSSYEEMAEIAKSEAGIVGGRYQNPEVLQKIIATMEHTGLIEVEEFNKETGYLRAKWFLPSSFFEGSKN